MARSAETSVAQGLEPSKTGKHFERVVARPEAHAAAEETPAQSARDVAARVLPDGTRVVSFPDSHPYSWPGYTVVMPPHALEGEHCSSWYGRCPELACPGVYSWEFMLWAIRDSDRTRVVLKGFEGTVVEDGEREARAMRDCAHSCVMPLLDVHRKCSDANIFGHGVIVLVLPLAERVFWEPFVEFSTTRTPPTSEGDVMSMVRSVASALKHVHANGYAHCDVKGDNIFLLDGKYVLGDFGSASRGPWGPEFPRTSQLTVSPDMVAARRDRAHYNGFKHDIWALGMTALTALRGRYPFPSVCFSDEHILLECIERGVELSFAYSPEMPSFLGLSLSTDPTHRAFAT